MLMMIILTICLYQYFVIVFIASNVNIAIQTDYGERIVHQFHPSTNLFNVLKQLEGDPGRFVYIMFCSFSLFFNFDSVFARNAQSDIVTSLYR